MSDRHAANGRMGEAEGAAPQSEVRLLPAGALRFAATAGGFLALTVSAGEQAEHFPRINAYRTFPLSDADRYISLRDADGNEIGILESLTDLARDQEDLLRAELERRYFTPVIQQVRSVKEEFGYSYWLVDTDAGPRRFTVQSGKNNVTVVAERRLLIVDVDGNRFSIADYTRLDRSVLRTLETLL